MVLKQLWKKSFNGKFSAKVENFAAKAPFPTFTPLLQYDLRLSAAKHYSISPAAAAMRELGAAMRLRSADTVTELQSTIELRTAATHIEAICSSKNGISTPKQKNNGFEAVVKKEFQRKI